MGSWVAKIVRCPSSIVNKPAHDSSRTRSIKFEIGRSFSQWKKLKDQVWNSATWDKPFQKYLLSETVAMPHRVKNLYSSMYQISKKIWMLSMWLGIREKNKMILNYSDRQSSLVVKFHLSNQRCRYFNERYIFCIFLL